LNTVLKGDAWGKWKGHRRKRMGELIDRKKGEWKKKISPEKKK